MPKKPKGKVEVAELPQQFDGQTDFDSNEFVSNESVAMPSSLFVGKALIEANAKKQRDELRKTKFGFTEYADPRNPALWEGADIGDFQAELME